MQVIDYKSALRQKNRRVILEGLANSGGEIKFTELRKKTGIPNNTFEHHLTILKLNKIITIEGDTIRLERKTPLCYIFDSLGVPYAYLGLLGERKERSETETETALKLLAKENFKFERVMVVTTKKCENEWKEVAPDNVEWNLIKNEEIKRIEAVESKIEQVLTDLIRKYILIMDCTSLTKPATIAYYKLATPGSYQRKIYRRNFTKRKLLREK